DSSHTAFPRIKGASSSYERFCWPEVEKKLDVLDTAQPQKRLPTLIHPESRIC
ncbi:hypothetical protein Moror_2211, partial [Moniliophthora roreri MCA 2997]